MITARRLADITVLGAAVVLGTCVALVPARAAATAPTFTYAQASLNPSSFTPASASVVDGSTIVITNSGSNTLTITGDALVGKGKSVSVPAGKSGSLTVPAQPSYPAKVVFTGTEDPNILNRGAASVTLTVTAPPAGATTAPAPPAAGASTAPGAPAGGGGAASGPPASTGGSARVVAPGLPGGVLPSAVAPGESDAPGLAPLIAPYLTPTPAGSGSGSADAPTPTGSGSRPATTTLTASGPTGGGGSPIRVPAVVSGVLLAGVAAALGKVLLGHSAARAVARRH